MNMQKVKARNRNKKMQQKQQRRTYGTTLVAGWWQHAW
jgi:hypothetical protein